MPKVELEIMRTVTVTREESVIVEVDVPKRVLADGDETCWVIEQLDKNITPKDKSVLLKAIGEMSWDVNDEDESFEIDDVTNLSE